MALRYYIIAKDTGGADLIGVDEFAQFVSYGYDNADELVAQAEEQARETGASNPIELTFTYLRIEDHD